MSSLLLFLVVIILIISLFEMIKERNARTQDARDAKVKEDALMAELRAAERNSVELLNFNSEC